MLNNSIFLLLLLSISAQADCKKLMGASALEDLIKGNPPYAILESGCIENCVCVDGISPINSTTAKLLVVKKGVASWDAQKKAIHDAAVAAKIQEKVDASTNVEDAKAKVQAAITNYKDGKATAASVLPDLIDYIVKRDGM